MRKLCAWCDRELAVSIDPGAAAPVSHGICASCRERMISEIGTPLRDYVDTLDEPVLIVGEDMVVGGVNAAARSLLGAGSDEVAGRFGGDVFECENARLPEGCGRTIHCSGCTIRNTVTDTWRTGEAHTRVPATLKLSRGDRPEVVALVISTERVDGHVLLRVEGLEGE